MKNLENNIVSYRADKSPCHYVEQYITTFFFVIAKTNQKPKAVQVTFDRRIDK